MSLPLLSGKVSGRRLTAYDQGRTGKSSVLHVASLVEHVLLQESGLLLSLSKPESSLVEENSVVEVLGGIRIFWVEVGEVASWAMGHDRQWGHTSEQLEHTGDLRRSQLKAHLPDEDLSGLRVMRHRVHKSVVVHLLWLHARTHAYQSLVEYDGAGWWNFAEVQG